VNGGQRRLDKIEAGLGPTEAMVLWLQETKERYRSLRELVEDLRSQPDEAWPLFQLTHQAETAAKAKLKPEAAASVRVPGQRREYVAQGERGAVRDVAALYYLFVGVNERFMAEQRATSLLIALHNALVGIWLHQDCPVWDEPLDRRIASCLSEVYDWQQVIAILAERYFQGVNPLLSDTAERLAGMLAEAELLAEQFNQALEIEASARQGTRKRTPKLPGPIDLDAVGRSTQPAAESHASLLVDMVQAEACEMMGEHKRALAFAARHL
jgi:hypothetical protein